MSSNKSDIPNDEQENDVQKTEDLGSTGGVPSLNKNKKKENDEDKNTNPMVKLANNLLEGMKPMGEGVRNAVSNVGDKFKDMYKQYQEYRAENQEQTQEQNQQAATEPTQAQNPVADSSVSMSYVGPGPINIPKGSPSEAPPIPASDPTLEEPEEAPPLPTSEPPSLKESEEAPALPTSEPPSLEDSGEAPALPTSEPPSLDTSEAAASGSPELAAASVALQASDSKGNEASPVELTAPPDSNDQGSEYSNLMQASESSGYGADAKGRAAEKTPTPAPAEEAGEGLSMGG